MPIKKSELYSSLRKSCDELRGGMDASQYKNFVLVPLFMKYVSDKVASQKGYLLDVPKGGSFGDMVAIARENPSLKGVLSKDSGRPTPDKHMLQIADG